MLVNTITVNWVYNRSKKHLMTSSLNHIYITYKIRELGFLKSVSLSYPAVVGELVYVCIRNDNSSNYSTVYGSIVL